MLLNVAGMVSVAKLLSTCIDANRLGCEVIQDFRKQSQNEISGTLKDATDVRTVVTQADLDAQKIIMETLLSAWGDDLNIVGEEDLTKMEFKKNSKFDCNIADSFINDHDEDVLLEDLTVFVDPLDGTREFVEGRLQNVGCLIGIAKNGKAIGGAVGVPFPNGKLDATPVVYYSLLHDDRDPLEGKYTTDTQSPSSIIQKEEISPSINIFTGDSSNPVLKKAIKKALSIGSALLSESVSGDQKSGPKSPNHHVIGGTAAKLLAVLQKKNSIAILHFVTSLWDTCATEALLRAKGGKVTDLFGSPLVHSENYKPKTNVFGVVASSGEDEISKLHDELCKQMREDSESVKKIFGKWMGEYHDEEGQTAQAIDIARDLDGAPLEVSWLQNQLQSNSEDQTEPFVLKGYAVPESTTARGLMSNGCRIMLEWAKNDDYKNESFLSLPPSSAFYKRVVMSESPDSQFKLKNVPHKLIRDVRSYQVETAFLTSDACQRGLIEEAGVHVNKVYASDLRPAAAGTGPKEQIHSSFAMLVQDLRKEDGWTQEWLLERESSKAALEAFARMHGYFWHGSDFWKREGGEWGRELEDAVWPNGGYMQPSLQGFDQLEKVAAGWTARLPSFEDDLKLIPELKNVNLNEIGIRLQRVAKTIGERSHPFYNGYANSNLKKFRTFIHGDPKQANIFLRKNQPQSNTSISNLEAGLIDFQWAGFGLGATDIAHHICAAVQPTCLSYDGSKESELLDYYYNCLTNSLIQNGVAASEEDVQKNVYPRDVLQEQYEIALLDVCRMVFAYAWKRWKPEKEPTPASLNRNAYNKSLPSVLWLITRCSKILSARENTLQDVQE